MPMNSCEDKLDIPLIQESRGLINSYPVSVDPIVAEFEDFSVFRGFYWYFKRFLDIVVSTFGLVISAPLWMLFAILIRLETPGPIFFFKECYGLGRRKFKQWKFRSMIHNAEKVSGPILAGVNDNRITRIGWILRKTAMDELPQLVNIFLGDMSFVGPRPQRVVLVDDRYVRELPKYHLRHLVRPGLTGVAQVYGRYDTTPRKKLKYDLLYVEKCNLLLDIKLFLMSLWISLRAGWQKRGKHR